MSDSTGDLIDQAEPITTTIDFAPQPRERKPQYDDQGNEKGVCRVCGNVASTPNGTYCAEHKTRQTKASTSDGGANTPSGTGTTPVSRPRTGRGAPTGEEWSGKVFDKLIILLSALLAGTMVRRYQLNDPNDAIADALTMEGDEARRIARPLGRYMAGTSFSKKQGRRILENSDLLDAGFALYDYWDRVNKVLRAHIQTQPHLASVTPIVPEPEGVQHGPIEPQTTGDGEPVGDFPNLSGWNYVP